MAESTDSSNRLPLFDVSHSLGPLRRGTCRPDSGGIEPVSPYLAVRKKEAPRSHMLCQLGFFGLTYGCLQAELVRLEFLATALSCQFCWFSTLRVSFVGTAGKAIRSKPRAYVYACVCMLAFQGSVWQSSRIQAALHGELHRNSSIRTRKVPHNP